MGIGDDIANGAKDAVGKAKEGIGDAVGNKDLENQGKVDQATAKVNQAVDDVKDKLHDATD